MNDALERKIDPRLVAYALALVEIGKVSQRTGLSHYATGFSDSLNDLASYIEAEKRESVEEFITHYYGPRCSEFNDDCIVCDHWRCIDEYFGIRTGEGKETE